MTRHCPRLVIYISTREDTIFLVTVYMRPCGIIDPESALSAELHEAITIYWAKSTSLSRALVAVISLHITPYNTNILSIMDNVSVICASKEMTVTSARVHYTRLTNENNVSVASLDA